MSGILSATLLSSGGDSSFWILSVGYTGTTDLEAFDVTTDTSGNMYLAGYDLDNQKAFLAKVNTDATISWQKTYSYGSSADYSLFNGLAKDGSGNIYPVGYVYNTAGAVYYFSMSKVAESTGNISFQRFLGTTSDGQYSASCVDSSGNIYGLGNRIVSSTRRMFLAKYTSAGSLSSQNLLSGSSSDGYSIAADSSGNLYISGLETNCVFAKLNSSLATTWGYKLTKTSSTVRAGTVFTDSSGNVYICGEYTGTNTIAFVQKYNSSGTLQWGRQISASGSDVLGDAVTVDSTGNVYLLCDVGTNNVAIIKYNSSGTLLWQRSMTNFYGGYAITISPGGSPIFCGISNEIVNGGTAYTALAVRVPADGSKTGTYTNGKAGGSYVYAVSTYTDAAVTLTATSWSTALTSQSMTDSAGSLTAASSSYTTAVANL